MMVLLFNQEDLMFNVSLSLIVIRIGINYLRSCGGGDMLGAAQM